MVEWAGCVTGAADVRGVPPPVPPWNSVNRGNAREDDGECGLHCPRGVIAALEAQPRMTDQGDGRAAAASGFPRSVTPSPDRTQKPAAPARVAVAVVYKGTPFGSLKRRYT